MKAFDRNINRRIRFTKEDGKLRACSPSKISLVKGCSFSIPPGKNFSCPGETEACEGCYAKKKRYTWSPVQIPMVKNWKLLKKIGRQKKPEKAAELMLEIIPENTKVFRIHSSGDFHSQWYVDMWAEVVRQRKDVRFWAYTRSFDFDFSKLTRLPNFNLFASTDRYNINEAKKFVRRFKKSGTRHAFGPWGHKDPIPPNSFICPATSGKLLIDGACEKCMLCVVKKATNKNVVFLAH